VLHFIFISYIRRFVQDIVSLRYVVGIPTCRTTFLHCYARVIIK